MKRGSPVFFNSNILKGKVILVNFNINAKQKSLEINRFGVVIILNFIR